MVRFDPAPPEGVDRRNEFRSGHARDGEAANLRRPRLRLHLEPRLAEDLRLRSRHITLSEARSQPYRRRS